MGEEGGVQAPRLWKVIVGGEVVRLGRSLASAALPERLEVGSCVEEKELVAERLRFRKVSGPGPAAGWVSVRYGGEELLRLLTPQELANIAPNEPATPSGSLVARRRYARGPLSLRQWYAGDEPLRSSGEGRCGVTRITLLNEDGSWSLVEECKWVARVQEGQTQWWDLDEMDRVSGVQVEDELAPRPRRRGAAPDEPRCLWCRGCARPPGHSGMCADAAGVELRPKPKPPRPGVYVGLAKDVTCPGDDVTYEVTLGLDWSCSLRCVPRLSLFGGGQPPWCCGGTWAFDGEAVEASITRADLKGPKQDTEVAIGVSMAGNALTFRDTELSWQSAAPLPAGLDISGWWTLTPISAGDIVHFLFQHKPGSHTFTGYLKGSEEIRDGCLEGDVVRWQVDDFSVCGRLADGGQRLEEVEVRGSGETPFLESFEGSRVAESGMCPVCLQDFEPGDTLRTLSCMHAFHAACVEKWLSQSGHCPLCRGPCAS